MWPHRRQPARLPRPWDSPGKNTGVGCHFLLQCMKVKSQSEVAQSCPGSLKRPSPHSLWHSLEGHIQACDQVARIGTNSYSFWFVPVLKKKERERDVTSRAGILKIALRYEKENAKQVISWGRVEACPGERGLSPRKWSLTPDSGWVTGGGPEPSGEHWRGGGGGQVASCDCLHPAPGPCWAGSFSVLVVTRGWQLGF